MLPFDYFKELLSEAKAGFVPDLLCRYVGLPDDDIVRKKFFDHFWSNDIDNAWDNWYDVDQKLRYIVRYLACIILERSPEIGDGIHDDPSVAVSHCAFSDRYYNLSESDRSYCEKAQGHYNGLYTLREVFSKILCG